MLKRDAKSRNNSVLWGQQTENGRKISQQLGTLGALKLKRDVKSRSKWVLRGIKAEKRRNNSVLWGQQN
jgi:hypothetical protein